MTTWLPGLCGLIVIGFTLLFALDPLFTRGNDQIVGGSLGFILGLTIAGMLYTVVWAVT